MTLETVSARWQDAFERLVGGMREYGLLVSPYITATPIRRMVQILEEHGVISSVRLDVLTDLSVNHVLRGSTDPTSIVFLMDAVPHTQVTYLPRLHAKVYAADESEAIITSANLTEHGLSLNYEYGVRITDPAHVRHIRDDLLAYGRLGNAVPRPEIEQLARTASDLMELSRRASSRSTPTCATTPSTGLSEVYTLARSGSTTSGMPSSTSSNVALSALMVQGGT